MARGGEVEEMVCSKGTERAGGERRGEGQDEE